MVHCTTIEINEEEVAIRIEFTAYFGEVLITKITDQITGDAICPDLDETNISAELYDELVEAYASREFIPLENEY